MGKRGKLEGGVLRSGKQIRATRRTPKYVVVGGKKKGESGRELSRHRTLKGARQSAQRYAEKGYYGAIQHRIKLTGEKRKKYGEYGWSADYRRGDIFSPK